MSGFLEKRLEFLKGVGPQRAELLQQELGLSTFHDLLEYYPFRYEDRTRFYTVLAIYEKLVSGEDPGQVQLSLTIKGFKMVGKGRGQRLIAQASDQTGTLDLVWFKGVSWITNKFKPGVPYVVYGKPALYGRKVNIAHPELSPLTENAVKNPYFQPVYSLTDKLKKKYIDSKVIGKWILQILKAATPHIKETLPSPLINELKLKDRISAYFHIHFPDSDQQLQKARFRLKFEEFFFIQLQLAQLKLSHNKTPGFIFEKSDLVNRFYKEILSFDLTGAQKKVVKEIYADLKSGQQMNRLLQGDVGSGKTVTAFIVILIAISNGFQAALMAPTEILSEQHFKGLKPFCDQLGIRIAKLSGSSTSRERKIILTYLKEGLIDFIVGTHALLEEKVQFKNLGLVVIDEQHRFGVAQRARLWQKNSVRHPHILVMTATPIPRTLAMTLYGDLDISIIDELPAGRKPIKTIHRYEANRIRINSFLKKEIQKGRQVYIVYPLIDESEKLDLNHLMDGFESVNRDFSEYNVSILHGKMPAASKDYEMQRFVRGETQIMVATTVIEVGVNVPNATVMVIENAERFGLAQLHQLRGRVGRGGDQSYCILISKKELSSEGRERLKTMVASTDGFVIAEKDLKIRGPGDLTGTQQSGLLALKLADIARDGDILKIAREKAFSLHQQDPDLALGQHKEVREKLQQLKLNQSIDLGRVS